ncbi:MAG TPA: VCBS repeat-containing protein [Kofleriaceae bacterium]|nr:VCBS repeat-containing protein [Kofleriaceae bacterium]
MGKLLPRLWLAGLVACGHGDGSAADGGDDPSGDAPGSVVYVADDAELDLTGLVAIPVPARVTIASGGAPGALLFTDRKDTLPLFSATGEGIRFTGLRLRGPDPDIGATPYGEPLARAIDARYADNLQVDHAELSGWSHAAVMFDYAHRGYVHHNSIHHNRRTGLGYGVLLNHDATVLVERNVFDDNRHDIAGTGRRELSYEARYNRASPAGNGHAFDMHGEDEATGNGAPWAGDLIRIHHNSFPGTSQPAIVIRGRPMTGAYVDHNCFRVQQSSGIAIVQRYFFGNLFAADNAYGVVSPSCHQGQAPGRSVRGDVNGDGLADLVTLARGNAWVYLGSASGVLTAVPPAFAGTMDGGLWDGEGHVAIDVADVTGDGFADLVTAHSDGSVHVYPGALAGVFRGAVTSFAGTYVGFEPIAVADVDGDGLADLVSHKGGSVHVHRGRADASFSGAPVSSFRGTYDSGAADGAGHHAVDVADVNGDGRADLVTIFESSGHVYRGQPDGAFGSSATSFAGTYRLALTGGEGFEPVGVADVNGDGRADLVSAHTDGNAYVHFGTTAGTFAGRADSFHNTLPTTLFGAAAGYEVIAALDVTGDGRADLVTAHTGGDMIVFPAAASGVFTTGARSFHGSYPVGRFDPDGHEALNEKPLVRRRGCAAAGCY